MARTLKIRDSAPKPNLLINSGMDFWQRGTSFSTGQAAYAADRFRVESTGAGIAVATTQQTDVPDSTFRFSMRSARGGTETALRQYQAVEAAAVKSYIGRTMTFSAWVKVVDLTAITLQVFTPTGGLDTWGTRVSSGNTALLQDTMPLVANVWTRVSVTFVVPSAAVDGIAVGMAATVGAAEQIYSTGWMLTEGPTVWTHHYRAYPLLDAELAACQRFYQKSYNITTAPTTNTTTGRANLTDTARSATTSQGVKVVFPVTMRASPTVTTYPTDGSPTSSWGYVQSGASAFTEAVVTTFEASQSGFGVNFSGTMSAVAAGDAICIAGHWTAEAEL